MSLIGSLLAEESAPKYEKSTEYAGSGQTVFNSTGFIINEVFVDSILMTTGYTGDGTGTITFTSGLSEFQEVRLTTG